MESFRCIHMYDQTQTVFQVLIFSSPLSHLSFSLSSLICLFSLSHPRSSASSLPLPLPFTFSSIFLYLTLVFFFAYLPPSLFLTPS